MQSTESFDKKVKKALAEATEQVTASDLLQKRIHNEINNQKMKEGYFMKNIKTIKKVAIIAAAICCITSVSVLAAGKITSYVSFSSKTANYTSVPTSKELDKKLGFSPKILESFSNGYKFESAVIVNTNGMDDNSKVVDKFKEISIKFKSSNGQKFEFSADKMPQEASEDNKKNITKYNNIEIKYYEQVYKFVPENYKLSEQDKADKESGKVVFSYGSESDGITTKIVKFTSWVQNGINYTIMADDSSLTEPDFTGMAKEVINK